MAQIIHKDNKLLTAMTSVALDLSQSATEYTPSALASHVNPIKRTDNRFVSTKGDLRHQGFGIANINEVVRKNNGHIFYDAADARFVVRLSLCNMKQNS